MPSPEVTTNFIASNGVDLGRTLITKDYLISVYPQLANQIITPELWTWGRNNYGQLGDNTTTNRTTPVTTFAGGTNWKQASCGYAHNAVIKTDGTLWTWGRNTFSSLGTNNTNNSTTPVTTFAGGTNWKQVSCAANEYSNAAIKTDGTLWVWGRNNYAELGINNGSPQLTPVTTFAGNTNWKQVACGNQFTAAIKTDGTLWVWGRNIYGQLGTNTAATRSTPVTTFAGGTNWKQVSCGGAHTVAIKTDGTLWTWGLSSSGQLGNGVIVSNRNTPVTTIVGGTNWKQVSCGGAHTAAIKTDGTLWTWGNNNYGQLGSNGGSGRTPNTTFAGGTNWKQVSCGNNHTTAIKTDGTLWTWGVNSNGRLGDNTTTNRSTPVTTFAGGSNWKQVSCGYSHTAAIKTSDDLTGL